MADTASTGIRVSTMPNITHKFSQPRTKSILFLYLPTRLQLTPCRLGLCALGRTLVGIGSQVLVEPADKVAHLGVVLAALAARVSWCSMLKEPVSKMYRRRGRRE